MERKNGEKIGTKARYLEYYFFYSTYDLPCILLNLIFAKLNDSSCLGYERRRGLSIFKTSSVVQSLKINTIFGSFCFYNAARRQINDVIKYQTIQTCYQLTLLAASYCTITYFCLTFVNGCSFPLTHHHHAYYLERRIVQVDIFSKGGYIFLAFAECAIRGVVLWK